MLLKYKTLVWRNDQRLQASRRRLTDERLEMELVVAECARRQGEIDLQQALAQAGELAGLALNRQQLFGWLRRSAADRRRSQALRLELHQQCERREQCRLQVEERQALCRRLERRLKRYLGLLEAERRKARLKQFDTEECELEERISWSR